MGGVRRPAPNARYYEFHRCMTRLHERGKAMSHVPRPRSLERRQILKGTAAAGLAGPASGVASPQAVAPGPRVAVAS